MAKSITDIDKNLKPIKLSAGLCFSDVNETAAKIYGLCESGRIYCRLPLHLHNLMNVNLKYLQSNTSGARLRFVTNSKRLGIKLQITNTDGYPHMPYSGYAGIDCFVGAGKNEKWLGCRWPELGQNFIHTEFELSGRTTAITVYLPLYTGIKQLLLGIEPGAKISAPPSYKHEDPIIFYGSSITQGGCASRPANSYPAIVCRQLQSNFINLGFSGNAKGEQWMAEHISSCQMRAFVYDYDHNAPSPEYLQNTHLPFIKTIIEKQPQTPILFISKPNPSPVNDDFKRMQIINESYEYAVKMGVNSRLINGNTFFKGKGEECCTVDGIHPNDLGFWRMSQQVYKQLNILTK